MTIKRMINRSRRFAWLTDWMGIRGTLVDVYGKGNPPQPKFNRHYQRVSDDPAFDETWFINAIRDKVLHHPDGILEYPFLGERIFDAPLVGFVPGDDPLIARYKEVIGSHHFSPVEIMAWQAEKNGVPTPPADELSVVCVIMPLAKATRQDNAKQEKWPAERWAQTRRLGEMFSRLWVREIVSELMNNGVLAVAPDATPMFRQKCYPETGWGSPWSHRHMAYAAGLGTFGLHDFFITEKGCAHRATSFVVHRRLEPNRERPDDIHAGCLQWQGIECMQCAKRCPLGAIGPKGHDKEACFQHVKSSIRNNTKEHGIFVFGCGLCSVGVPCESRDPVKKSDTIRNPQ